MTYRSVVLAEVAFSRLNIEDFVDRFWASLIEAVPSDPLVTFIPNSLAWSIEVRARGNVV